MSKAPILDSKILLFSSQNYKISHKITKSLSVPSLSTQSFSAIDIFSQKNKHKPPLMAISNNKIIEFLPNIARLMNNRSPQLIKPLFTCKGHFCHVDMRVSSIAKPRFISRSIFSMISHDFLTSTVEKIVLPATEQELARQLAISYTQYISTNQGFSDKKAGIQRQFGRQTRKDLIKLCPTCYRIYKVACFIELGLDI